MKLAVLGAALIVGAVAAAGVAATRTLAAVPDAPDAAQVQAWLHGAADGRDVAAEAALAQWTARGDRDARRAYAALLAHRADPASRQRLEQVLDDGARAGDALAATQLAELLARTPASGQADARDARITRLLAQGAAAHVPAAARALALRTPDPAQAARMLAQAAEDGDAPAMFLLANQLRAGQGAARDDARALALYQRAADADYAPAIQALTLALRYGELGLQADASQSRLMDHEAAEALAHAAH